MKKNKSVKKKSLLSKIWNIFINIFCLIFFITALFTIYSSIQMKKSGDDGATLFGHQMRVVVSPSMEKCDQTDVSNFKIKDIKTKSLIFIKTVPEDENQKKEFYKDIEVGDVLTFKYVYTKQITITHRVVKIDDLGNGNYKFYLEGDNKNDNSGVLQQVIDTSVDSTNYIIGKVTGVNYPLGLIINSFKSPVGIVCFVIAPCSIIIIYEIIRIITEVSKDKKEKHDEISNAKDAEIEELKKKLDEALKNKDEDENKDSEE